MPEIAGGFDKKQLLIVGAAGVGAFLWYRHQKNAAAASSGGTQDTSAGVGLPTATDPSAAGGYGGGMTPGANYTGTTQTLASGSQYTTPGSNAAWMQDAVAYLSSLGQDASTVSAALGAYLAGTPITTAQQGIVQQALGAFGPTPTTVPLPIVGGSSPNPSGSKQGRPIHTITVGKGETQKQVINRAGIPYSELLALNPNTHLQGGKIHPGQKLVV